MRDEVTQILAHPASDPLRLPIEAWSLGLVAAILVVAAAALTKRSEVEPEDLEVFEPRGAGDWTLRVLAAGVLLGTIVVARIGSPFELENPASVLAVAFVWPLLGFVSLALPSLWDRIDPFDTLARIFHPDDEAPPERGRSVMLASAFALGWTWYLSVYRQPLDPGTFGFVLGAYTIAMLAACLAAGRRSWLLEGEAIGATVRTIGMTARGRIASLPRHADLLLSVVAGGLLFGVVRLTALWGDLNVSEMSTLWGTIGLVGSCAIVYGLWALVRRFAPTWTTTVLIMGPFTAGAILAVGLLRNRFFAAGQLLPRLLLDPLDSGFDPLGQEDSFIDPNPLGTTGLVMTQIVILTLGAMFGVVVARRRVGSTANPAIGACCALLFVSVLLVAGVAFPG